MNPRNKPASLNKDTNPIPVAPIRIHSRTLRRVKIVTSHMNTENMTQFISSAAEEKVERLAKRHSIQFPAELVTEAH